MGLLKAVFGGGDRSQEGVPGRAVVRWGHCGIRPGTRATTARTKLELLLPDGSSVKHVEQLPWKLAVALCGWPQSDGPDWHDTEIGVRMDPSDGTVIALDRPAIKEELADRFPAIERSWSIRGQFKREVTDVVDSAKSIIELPVALTDAAKSLKDDLTEPVDDTLVIPDHMQIADEDPALASIEGVSYEAWIAVQGGMLREKVKPNHRNEYADAHGIPNGRWDVISGEWMARATSNQGLAIRFAQDLERAKKGL